MTYGRSDVRRADITDVLDTSLAASGGGLLANDAHSRSRAGAWVGGETITNRGTRGACGGLNTGSKIRENST